MLNDKYLTVHALSKYIKYKFDQDPYLEKVYLKGELTNVKLHTNGHLFFDVKDDKSVIRGVLFKGKANLTFQPENGLSVLIEGNITTYPERGYYQIYVDSIQIDGIGQLFEQLEKDKKYLIDNGYTDDSNKKPLPKYPAHIIAITSETSAALQDIKNTLNQRFPLVHLEVMNTLMQGSKSVDDVIENLNIADEKNADLIILARGGGSLEELWSFNNLNLAIKIASLNTPIITGVGHETDTTLVDYVSDHRAPTPTGAAMVAVPHYKDVSTTLLNIQESLYSRQLHKVSLFKETLNTFKNYYIFKRPELIFQRKVETLSYKREKLDSLIHTKLINQKNKHKDIVYALDKNDPTFRVTEMSNQLSKYRIMLNHFISQQLELKHNQIVNKLNLLDSLSPSNIMLRGYSYTKHGENIIKNVNHIKKGDTIKTVLTNGELISKVTEVNQND